MTDNFLMLNVKRITRGDGPSHDNSSVGMSRSYSKVSKRKAKWVVWNLGERHSVGLVLTLTFPWSQISPYLFIYLPFSCTDTILSSPLPRYTTSGQTATTRMSLTCCSLRRPMMMSCWGGMRTCRRDTWVTSTHEQTAVSR